MPDIAGVIFDMDGLLLDTERVYLDAFRATMKDHGLPPDDDIFVAMVGVNATAGAEILNDGLAGRTDPARFDADLSDRVRDRFAQGIPAKPGVRDVIEALDVPHIIATSTRTDKAAAHLDVAGLGDLFPDIIGGDQVTRSKPEPDIYLAAASALSIPPTVCAAFEDSPNGVRAAHAAGMIVVQVPDVVPPDDTLRALGHHIAPTLLDGARHLGLISGRQT